MQYIAGYSLEDYLGEEWGLTLKQRLGSILRKFRTEKAVTQKHLASVLGVSNDSVYRRWELGYSFPRFEMLLKLADYYSLDVHKDILAPAVAGLYRSEQIDTLTKNEQAWLELYKMLNASNQAQILNAGQIILLSQGRDS